MIFYNIVTMVFAVIDFLVSLLPDPNSTVVSVLSGASLTINNDMLPIMDRVAYIFPLAYATQVISAGVFVLFSIFLFKFTRYIIGLLTAGLFR